MLKKISLSFLSSSSVAENLGSSTRGKKVFTFSGEYEQRIQRTDYEMKFTVFFVAIRSKFRVIKQPP